jgi:hypothetical protein
MASRYIRNTLIALALEATAGVDALPTGAANAQLISDMSIEPLDAKNIPREVIRGFFGGSEELVGVASVKVSFTAELAGSGAAATPPAWGAALIVCAFAEASLTTPARVEYTPVSTGLRTATIYYYDDGVLHKLFGVMGNVTISAKAGDRPTLKFDFVGLDGGVATATDVGVFTAWKKPVAITKANVVDFTLGATYAAGALTGGTVYPSTGVEIQVGNSVEFDALCSEETVDITNRSATGSVELKLTPAQEVAFMASVKQNLTQSAAFTIGTVTGAKIILFMPSVQLRKPKKVDRSGKRLIGYELGVLPLVGNDDVRLICI